MARLESGVKDYVSVARVSFFCRHFYTLYTFYVTVVYKLGRR